MAERLDTPLESRRRVLPRLGSPDPDLVGRVAERFARFMGTGRFLMYMTIFVILWVVLNTVGFVYHWDAYPFILLNLVLSCVAAVQAPIIMMSQQRQEAKDRLRSLNDYQVNLKAELEIRQLHEKIDHLLNRQWHRLVEIQKLQMELMEKHQS